MTALWVAASILLGIAVAFMAWAIANRHRRVRMFAGVGGAFIAIVGLAYITYAIVVYCEAPPGSACL